MYLFEKLLVVPQQELAPINAVDFQYATLIIPESQVVALPCKELSFQSTFTLRLLRYKSVCSLLRGCLSCKSNPLLSAAQSALRQTVQRKTEALRQRVSTSCTRQWSNFDLREALVVVATLQAKMSEFSSDLPNTEDTTSGALVEDVLVTHDITPAFVSGLGEAHLLFFLPLILNAIQDSKTVSPLLEPLRQRVCSSRKVKLRFLLLRKHPAFLSFPSKLAYSSAAYGVPSLIGTRISPPSCSGYLDELHARVKIRIPVDMVDLQSEDFFRSAIFQSPSENEERFGMQLLSHPFSSSQFKHDVFSDEVSFSSRGLTEDFEYEEDTFQTARIHRKSGQRIAELQRLKLDAEEVRESNLETLLPRLIVKENQDVLKMQATQMLFYFFNHIWTRASEKYEDAESAPLCISFDAVATHARKGLLHGFEYVQSFQSFSFDFWRDVKGHDPVAVDQFVRSAAGAFTAGYIVGIDYRSGEEVCVKDGNTVFVRETEGVFETSGPRLAIPKAMRECFQKLRVWDEFRLCCIRAFDVGRISFGEILPMVRGLYARCGVSEKKISDFVSGRNSLNLGQKDRRRVDEDFRKWLG